MKAAGEPKELKMLVPETDVNPAVVACGFMWQKENRLQIRSAAAAAWLLAGVANFGRNLTCSANARPIEPRPHNSHVSGLLTPTPARSMEEPRCAPSACNRCLSPDHVRFCSCMGTRKLRVTRIQYLNAVPGSWVVVRWAQSLLGQIAVKFCQRSASADLGHCACLTNARKSPVAGCSIG